MKPKQNRNEGFRGVECVCVCVCEQGRMRSEAAATKCERNRADLHEKQSEEARKIANELTNVRSVKVGKRLFGERIEQRTQREKPKDAHF